MITTADEAETVLRRGAELVEWVCQRYVHNPLLVHGRKFHLRVNVLAVGALQVRLFAKAEGAVCIAYMSVWVTAWMAGMRYSSSVSVLAWLGFAV